MAEKGGPTRPGWTTEITQTVHAIRAASAAERPHSPLHEPVPMSERAPFEHKQLRNVHVTKFIAHANPISESVIDFSRLWSYINATSLDIPDAIRDQRIETEDVPGYYYSNATMDSIRPAETKVILHLHAGGNTSWEPADPSVSSIL